VRFLGSSDSGIHWNIPSACFIELFYVRKLAVSLLSKDGRGVSEEGCGAVMEDAAETRKPIANAK